MSTVLSLHWKQISLSIIVAVTLIASLLWLRPFQDAEQPGLHRSLEAANNNSGGNDGLHKFGAVDYVIFSAVLCVSASTGLYHAFSGGGQKTTSKFLMAERSMMSVPVAISTLASFLSAITILGTPAEIYMHGIQFWMIIFSFFITIPITALVFIPIFHGLKLTSAYEFLQKRFSMSVRAVSACVFILQTTFYVAVVLYAPALALEAVTHFEVYKTILITGCICTLYTSLGGIKAVIYTDVFQFLVLFGSLITVLAMGTIRAGGISNVWQINKENNHLNFFEWSPDPTTRLTFWSLVIGGAFTNIPVWAVSQTAVQRFLTAKSKQEAVKSVWINLPGNIIMISLVSFLGIVLYAFYHDGSHNPPKYQSSDQILVYFVNEEFGSIPGIQGLFVSCMFAGTLSTVASGLNALATVSLIDLVKPLRNHYYLQKYGYNFESTPASDARDTKISKILTCSFGIACICIAFIARKIGSLIQAANSIFGAAGGPLLGVFTLGIFSRRSNTGGALVGLISGFSLAMWIMIGALINQDPETKEVKETAFVLYKISFMLYSTVSFLATFITGIIASEIVRCIIPEERTKYVDPAFLVPCLRPKDLHSVANLKVGEATYHSLHYSQRQEDERKRERELLLNPETDDD